MRFRYLFVLVLSIVITALVGMQYSLPSRPLENDEGTFNTQGNDTSRAESADSGAMQNMDVADPALDESWSEDPAVMENLVYQGLAEVNGLAGLQQVRN